MTTATFNIANVPVNTPKAVENEYTPFVDQLIELGLDSGKELRGAFDNKDGADIAKQKFQAAARGRGVSGLGRIREYDADLDGKANKDKVILGLSVKDKITRNRKKADETEAE